MDLKTERKIRINEFFIKARWFYILGILCIEIINELSFQNSLSFYGSIFALVFSAILLNVLAKFALKRAIKEKLYSSLDGIGAGQIFFEMFLFLIIMYFNGGIESVAYVFFFLPIVASSFLMGPRGSLLTAYFSASMVVGLAILEYANIIPHIDRHGVFSEDHLYLSVVLPKVFNISLFYVIVGAVSGFGAKLLNDREEVFGEQAEKLKKERGLRMQELIKLDIAAKKLIKRELDLTTMNQVLDKNLEDLKEEKNKTMAIVSNFSDPIIAFNKEGRLVLFNPAAQKMLNLTDENLSKMTITEKKCCLKNFKKAMGWEMDIKQVDDPENLLTEEVSMNYNNKQMTYKVRTVKLLGNRGEYLGMMKIFFDLTREKMIDQMKSDFISIAAHQLRTPLSAIKWTLRMILDGDVGKISKEQADLLDKGYESNERMISLVNDLLNVSRIEEGRFGYRFEKGSLREVINTVVENLEKFIAKKHISLTIDYLKIMPDVIMDKSKMALVIQNLLENSIKYTPENGKIHIAFKNLDGSIEAKIEDNGVGIPKKDSGRIFSKFFRASNVMRMETDGTGLGLFIVKNIVESHGGRVSIKSQEGKGTGISFTLPIDQKAKI